LLDSVVSRLAEDFSEDWIQVIAVTQISFGRTNGNLFFEIKKVIYHKMVCEKSHWRFGK